MEGAFLDLGVGAVVTFAGCEGDGFCWTFWMAGKTKILGLARESWKGDVCH